MPESNDCFNIFSIPVVHTSKEKFNRYIDIALECESDGFAADEDGFAAEEDSCVTCLFILCCLGIFFHASFLS